MAPDPAAVMVARLEERLAGYEKAMAAWMAVVREDVSQVQADVKSMRTTLDEAKGGMAFGRWVFGAGSLAAVIGTFAGLYTWVRSWVGH